jgi:peptide/nickel transport system permease protein
MRGPGLLERALRWPRRQRLSFSIPLLISGLIAASGLAAPLITTYDPVAVNVTTRLEPPSRIHLFGTDEVGRDVFTRVLYGARITVLVLCILPPVLVVATTVGLVSGMGPRRLDEVAMRFVDLMLAFPPLLLAMALVATLGPSLFAAMGAVGMVWWPRYARLIRGQVLLLKRAPFVESATAIGCSPLRVMWRHILPNCRDVITVRATVDAGYLILLTASLSFIGLGAKPPSPEWGAMVAAGRRYMLDQWWIATFPGLAIFITVLCLALLGDELRDRFDPRLRGET